MTERKYLLNITEIELAEAENIIWNKVFSILDSDRLKKLEHIKSKKARASCAGAGLLLQWAIREREAKEKAGEEKRKKKEEGEEKKEPEIVKLEDILKKIKTGIDFQTVYGINGKPSMKEHLFSYNISHSGDYVLCGVSDSEIGVDLQCIRENNRAEREQDERIKKLADRFFAEGEKKALANCGSMEERRDFFYKLWTRKEAIGKLGGEGLARWLESDFSDIESERWKAYSWEEYAFEDYRITVCKRKENL